MFVNTKWPRRSPQPETLAWRSRARQILKSDCIHEVECNYVLYRGIFVLSRIETRSLRGILYLRGYIGSVTNFNTCFRGVCLIFESIFPTKLIISFSKVSSPRALQVFLSSPFRICVCTWNSERLEDSEIFLKICHFAPFSKRV